MTGDARYLTVRIVARRLGCCEESVRRYIRSGKLLAQRVPQGRRGGNYLIPEVALRRFLATSCDTQPPETPHVA